MKTGKKARMGRITIIVVLDPALPMDPHCDCHTESLRSGYLVPLAMVRYRQSTIGTVQEEENRHSPGIGTEDHLLETDTAFGTDIHIRTQRIKDRHFCSARIKIHRSNAEVIRHYLQHCT